MTDAQAQAPITITNAAAAIEKAKDVADRYKRQIGFLTALNGRLPILESALEYNIKIHKESGEDITRLTKEVDAAKKHIAQLSVWVANHADLPDDIATANTLAEKIKKLQKTIERQRDQLHRMEAGLPSLDVEDGAKPEFNSNGDKIK